MIFEKIKCLVSTYKSGSLNGKLPKRTIYIYIREFILFLNQLLHNTYLKKNYLIIIIIINILLS